MSRIGRLPIEIVSGVEVKIADSVITVKGPKGELTLAYDPIITVKVEGNQIICTRANDEADTKAKHGLYRKLIANMVEGVTKGFSKQLTINGVGYKVEKKGNKLVMDIGYSHPVEVEEVPGITLECPSSLDILVKGINKELVGQVAADIKRLRIPDPYHAYGIRYSDEVIARKEGKKGGKGKK